MIGISLADSIKKVFGQTDEAMENNLIKALEGTALYDLLIVSNEPDYEYDYEYDYSEDI